MKNCRLPGKILLNSSSALNHNKFLEKCEVNRMFPKLFCMMVGVMKAVQAVRLVPWNSKHKLHFTVQSPGTGQMKVAAEQYGGV